MVYFQKSVEVSFTLLFKPADMEGFFPFVLSVCRKIVRNVELFVARLLTRYNSLALFTVLIRVRTYFLLAFLRTVLHVSDHVAGSLRTYILLQQRACLKKTFF